MPIRAQAFAAVGIAAGYTSRRQWTTTSASLRSLSSRIWTLSIILYLKLYHRQFRDKTSVPYVPHATWAWTLCPNSWPPNSAPPWFALFKPSILTEKIYEFIRVSIVHEALGETVTFFFWKTCLNSSNLVRSFSERLSRTNKSSR